MKVVDLNADVGESFGIYRLGMDNEVFTYITSANIACGLHAGDPLVMAKTVQLALTKGVAIGAHPGYPDLQGFGRRSMNLRPDEVKAFVIYQLGALQAFARAAGTILSHVKPHGALYNTAAVNRAVAEAVVEAILAVDENLILLALASSEMVRVAKEKGLRVAEEVFADRAYNADGTLVARGQPGAMIEDPAVAIPRAVRMVTEGKVQAISGEEINVNADSICVHGDNPQAVAFAAQLKEALTAAGVKVCSLGEVLRVKAGI